MMGNRRAIEAMPAKMSLAQFTKNLTSGVAPSVPAPPRVDGTTMAVEPEGVGEKRFASDVVAAMSSRPP